MLVTIMVFYTTRQDKSVPLYKVTRGVTTKHTFLFKFMRTALMSPNTGYPKLLTPMTIQVPL